MDAAIVELDPLTDAIRPPTQDHDLAPRRGIGFTFLLVCGVQVRGVSLKLGGTGVDALKGGIDAQLLTQRTDRSFVLPEEGGKMTISIAEGLAFAEEFNTAIRPLANPLFELDNLLNVRQEPGVDMRELVDGFNVKTGAEGLGYIP